MASRKPIFSTSFSATTSSMPSYGSRIALLIYFGAPGRKIWSKPLRNGQKHVRKRLHRTKFMASPPRKASKTLTKPSFPPKICHRLASRPRASASTAA